MDQSRRQLLQSFVKGQVQPQTQHQKLSTPDSLTEPMRLLKLRCTYQKQTIIVHAYLAS